MQKITPLPKPPTTQDSTNFDIRADEFLESLPKFAEELNAFVAEIDNIGNAMQSQLDNEIEKGKIALQYTTQNCLEKVQEVATQKQKRLEAIAAIKSDSWQNIAQFILLLLRKVRQKLEKEREQRERLLEYKLFFRSELPKGYVRARSMLKITQYPLAWWYCRNLNTTKRSNAKKGYFMLPSGNMYVKGVSDKSLIGDIGEAGLPNITGTLSSSKSWAGSFASVGSGSGALRSQTYSGHTYVDSGGMAGCVMIFNASLANPIYKNNHNKVEVDRVHLLEGYYVGE